MKASIGFARIRNGMAIPRRDIPDFSFADFRAKVVDAVASGGRLACLFGDQDADAVHLYAVVADSMRGQLHVAKARLDSDRFAFTVVVPLSASFMYLLMVFTFGLAGDLGARQSAYPPRMFTLPLTSAALAGWPMLYGTAAMAGVWIAAAQPI